MARSGKAFKYIPSTEIFQKDLVAKNDLGAMILLDDGRQFVYGQNGAGALTAGQLTQAAPPVTNHANCTLVGAFIGGGGSWPASGIPVVTTGAITLGQTIRALQITVGATAVTAGQYAGGYLVLNAGTGLGTMVKILKHDVIASSGTGWFYFEEPISYTGVNSADTKVTLVPADAGLVIVAPTTLTADLFGVAIQAMASNEYGWFQVKGPGAMIAQGTLVVGNNVIPSATTAGTVSASASDVLPVVGTVIMFRAATEAALVDIAIPGY